MKRRIILSIALALSVVTVTLMGSDSTAKAQNQIRVVADTGVTKLGPNQTLRLTVNAGAGKDTVTVRFKGMEYVQSVCSDGVCKSVLTAQNNPSPLLLMPGEAASYDLGDTATHEVRSMVLSNSRDVVVNALIIDTETGQITSLVQMSMQRENQ